jgi:hypothetical protein
MFDVTLTDNFQYQRQLVDTDNITLWDERSNVVDADNITRWDERSNVVDTDNITRWGQLANCVLKCLFLTFDPNIIFFVCSLVRLYNLNFDGSKQSGTLRVILFVIGNLDMFHLISPSDIVSINNIWPFISPSDIVSINNIWPFISQSDIVSINQLSLILEITSLCVQNRQVFDLYRLN